MLGNLGKYELLDILGTGGQGTVYRARDQALDRMVAVKVVRQDLAHDEKYLRDLFTEARVAGSLNHPNITVVYDLDIVDEKPYIAMELAQSSLSSRLENGVQIPFQEAVQIAVAICGALEHCHANNVIHRDIKPQNILLTSDGQPKLTDFGIARPPESTTRAARHQAGTVTYMSPEQITGTSTDGRSDIYSLGVVLYEMFTGSPPFVGETEYQVLNAHIQEPVPSMSPRLGIPPQLEEIVFKSMEKRPENRFASANAMGAALERVLAAGQGRERLTPWPPSSGTSPAPLAQRSPDPLRNFGSLANDAEFEAYPLPAEHKLPDSDGDSDDQLLAQFEAMYRKELGLSAFEFFLRVIGFGPGWTNFLSVVNSFRVAIYFIVGGFFSLVLLVTVYDGFIASSCVLNNNPIDCVEIFSLQEFIWWTAFTIFFWLCFIAWAACQISPRIERMIEHPYTRAIGWFRRYFLRESDQYKEFKSI